MTNAMIRGIDIEGIERRVMGFHKTANTSGEYAFTVEYKLQGVSLSKLQEIFQIDKSSDDQIIIDLIDPLDINKEQAILLNPYVVDGEIDVDKYFFELHCVQAPGYDWSQGYPIKIE